MFVVLTGTMGTLSGVAVATGEEIGWRGFLVPERAKTLPPLTSERECTKWVAGDLGLAFVVASP